MNAHSLTAKSKGKPILRENRDLILNFIFSVFFIGLGFWFLHHERTEIHQVRQIISTAAPFWLISGILLSLLYLFLHGFMYRQAFKSIGCNLSVLQGTMLFLKRNFVSVFLPAGGVSSLAFFTGTIEKQGISKTQIHLASSIYGFIGILSVIVVAIPTFIYGLFKNVVGVGEWAALFGIVLLLFALYLLYKSLVKKGKIFVLVKKYFPAVEVYIDDLNSNKIILGRFLYSLFFSVLIEFSGILHLLIAMKAMGFQTSVYVAILGYIVAVVFLVISPFLRGVGPVEVSLTFVLTRFGFSSVEAIAVTFLYRFFEFWIPLFAGLFAFFSKVNKLLMRVLPALLLFALGIVNIVSVMTPAISSRLNLLSNFLPISFIRASDYFVITAGLFLLITSAFMLKGLRLAWVFAIILSSLSLIGHLTKAIDYEEAIVAGIVIISLVASRHEYYVKSNPKLRMAGIQTSLLSILAVLIYGTIGFYFLDQKHFHINFCLWQSVRYTIQNFFLVGSADLVTYSNFARHFLWSINISGFITIAFLVYTLIVPYVSEKEIDTGEKVKAENLLQKFGNSALDYFKISDDKLLFFSPEEDAFLAYRVAGNFAVVLENPVAESKVALQACISTFDKYCAENGLRSLYYRVPESELPIYKSLGKKALFIGQEGIVNLQQFNLEGGSKKTIRNALNKVSERGFKATFHEPPVKDGIIQKIKAVSDEWLNDMDRSELVFSQGMFNWDELKKQTIITVENNQEKVVAFLNIIPDFAKDEATYDLIRKTKDAPNGMMDFILVELFQYLRQKGFNYVNMGFAPMSGITQAQNFPERSIKFAYEKIKSFSHYKGLRDYKEKFEPVWYNKYMVYEHDYDLLQAPSALNKVIKP